MSKETIDFSGLLYQYSRIEAGACKEIEGLSKVSFEGEQYPADAAALSSLFVPESDSPVFLMLLMTAREGYSWKRMTSLSWPAMLRDLANNITLPGVREMASKLHL